METTPEEKEIQKRQETIDGVRQMLDFLEANPQVTLPRSLDRFAIWFFGEKDEFLQSVKHFGSCEKSIVDKELHVTKMFGSVKLVAEVNRDQRLHKANVMKTVQEVDEWDCEPLLSQAEIQQIGQEVAVS
jgi:hypothetical protein